MILLMTQISVTPTLPATDITAVFATKEKTGFVISSGKLTSVQSKKLAAAAKSMKFSGGASELVSVPGSTISVNGIVMVVGVGENPNHETFRKAAGIIGRNSFGAKKLAIVVDDENVDAIGAIAQGALLGSYSFNVHRSESVSAKREGVKAIVLVSSSAKNPLVRDAIDRAEIVSNFVNETRNLANTAPGHLPPAEVAKYATGLAKELKLKIEVLDEKMLKRKGFGGIVGVGQGSVNPPRLIRIEYRPLKPVAHIAFVGKGITFDTGGISIKPHLGMHEMKADMAGAAAVINAIAAIAELKIPVSITTYAACAENMPSGSAQRPGDVVTAYGGRTVEVLDTDAEGRLVLMDALVYAQEVKPDLVIDVATLTGAAVIALGRRIAAVMANNDDLRSHVVDAGARSGESMWPLPLPSEYRPRLDSAVADIANIAERYGSTLYGGLFLQEFIKPGQKWVHLDIAAPAFNSEGPFDYTPKGATGSAVRTLVTIAEDVASGLLKLR
jgi:leucyl aminopeptidase